MTGLVEACALAEKLAGDVGKTQVSDAGHTSRATAACLLASASFSGHFTCRQQRRSEPLLALGLKADPLRTALHLGGLATALQEAGYLEQGDCGAVEEAQ